jgi:GNAT superfamily N-acetyltransferase
MSNVGAEDMEAEIRLVCEPDAEAMSALVVESFLGPASEGWEPKAIQVLLAEASVASLRQKLRQPAFAAGAFAGQQAVGFVLVSVPSVLAMLFVHPQYLRRGVGSELWEAARSHIEAEFPQTRTVELNSTRFALPFYLRAGFVPISAEWHRAGCRATRMACWLPARALGAECPPTLPSGGQS